MNILKKILASFDNDKLGYSARKLSAFAAVLVSIYITAKLLPAVAQIDALYAWLLFALLCLGIITIENIINLKNLNKDKENTNNNNLNQ